MKQTLMILVLIFISMTSAWAVKVASVYQADVQVSSQSDTEKKRGIREGLTQVLIKLTGNPEVRKIPSIQSSLEKADFYVQEFSYTSEATSPGQYVIRIHYDENEVKRLLKKAGLAYWGESRPLILVWLAVTNPEQTTEIIGNDTPGNLFHDMKQQGKKYGLPLIFPMMDVADMSQVTSDDIKTSNVALLKEAGKRYAPAALLIGRIQQGKQGQQNSEWQLVLDDNNWHWTISGQSTQEIIDAILNQTNQALAKRYIVKTIDAPQIWLTLEISNVTERHDLVQVLQYLKQLTLVQQVALSQISGDTVELSVLVQGSYTAFMQNASIGQRLVLKSKESNKLIYEWVH